MGAYSKVGAYKAVAKNLLLFEMVSMPKIIDKLGDILLSRQYLNPWAYSRVGLKKNFFRVGGLFDDLR